MATKICHASSQLPRSETWRLCLPFFASRRGVRNLDCLWEREVSKWAYVPFLILLTSRLEGVARDHGSEGGVEEAAVSRDLEWWVFFRRLNFFFLHASESLDDELLKLLDS